MSKTKKIKGWLLALLTALLVCCFGFALAQILPASAAAVSVTVQTDGNGTVSYGGSTSEKEAGSSIAVTANSGEQVTLTASADEGYVFAYWYTVENTPLSYEASYDYTMPAETTTVHAKFFENEDGKVTVTAEGWTVDGGAGTYKLISTGDSDNFGVAQDMPIYFEFVGEKWFTFDYKLSLTTNGSYQGKLSVSLDGVNYLKDKYFESWDCEIQKNLVFKANKNKYHRVEIVYQTPQDMIPTALEFTLSGIVLKNESEYGYAQTPVKWDARLGEVYYLPGIFSTSYDTDTDFVIGNGAKLEIEGDEAHATVPVGVPIAFAVKPYEQVKSTLDPEEMTGVHLMGVNYGAGGNTGDIALVKFNTDGKIAKYDGDVYSEGGISFDLKEIAIFPKVSFTKSVDSVPQEEETISHEGSVDFPYGKKNDLLVTIDHYKTVTSSFTITSNGDAVSCETLTGKTGFSLTNITENQAVVITYSYGEKYYVEEPFTFNVYIKLDGGNDGLDSILSPISHEVTITNDEQYPWYFDPAGNGEGSFAFSSGISYQKDGTLPAPVFSQLGFTFKGNGSFTFEFHIDGYGGKGADTDDTKAKYSYAAYRIDSPIPTDTPYKSGWLATNPSWTEAPWGVKGFKPEIATNLGWGVSTSATSLMAPRIFDATTVDAKNFWYKVTISIKGKGDDEETSIYIAHAIGNKSNSSYACMSVRNVAFFSGTAYIDWGVQNANNESGDATDITVKQNEKDATSGKIDAGSMLTFEANPKSGTFYGWKAVSGALTEESAEKANDPESEITDKDIQWDTENARYVSYDEKYNYIVGTGYTKIVAVIDTEGTYAVRNGSKFYSSEEIQTVLNDVAAGKDKNVVVVDNVALSGITVPAGVNLVIPFNRTGDFYAMGTAATAQTRVSWASGDAKYKDPVYTLTLSGANIINGTLTVGGVLHYPDQSAQGHTSGAYSQLVLSDEGTTLTVGNGGHLDVYGRVTGEGSIDVTSGGKLTQPFMITDYNGGTNTEASFNAGVTPFKMYAMVNVQNKGGFTIHHGAELYGHASLYFWSSITTIDAPFISYVKETRENRDYFQNDALIVLREGASAHIVYDDAHGRVQFTDNPSTQNVKEDDLNNVQDVGKTTITLTGGAYADFMQFPLGINTTQVYFSVPYNFDITLKSGGTFDILHPYKMMPGSSFTVEENATLTVRTPTNGLPNGLHVYDSFFIPAVAKRTYPTGQELINAGYTPYASLIVNGTLNIQDGATFLGTVQTKNTTGTAKIIVGNNVKLSDDTLFDGVSTEYSCNYTKYTLTAQVYDAAHKCMGKLEAGKTYTSVAPVKDATWQLPGITFQYETKTGAHSGAHTLGDITTEGATLETGSWKVEHGGHQYDWSQLSDEEKNLNGKKYKELTHQCTEIGCTEKEHKLLLAADFSLNATYKGAEFTDADLLAIFYQYYFGREHTTVPAQHNYFSASVTGATSIQNVQTYAGITVTLTNGYFGDVNKDSTTFTFTIEKFNINTEAFQNAVESALKEKNFVYDGTAKSIENSEIDQLLNAELNKAGVQGTISRIAPVWANNTNAGTDTASVTIKGSGANFTGTLTVNFSIAKAQLTVTLEETTQIYGETVKTPDITLDGVVNNEESQIKAAITRTPQAEQWSEVGNYAVDWSYSEEEGVLANYEISFNNKEETLYRVTAKDITKSATATAESATYNGMAQEARLSFTFEGYTDHFGTKDYTVRYAKGEETSPVNAGTYTVTIEAQGNYSGSITCNYTIEKAQVTVTVTQQTYTFDRTQHSYNDQADGAWTAEGLQNEENKSLLDVSITGSGTDANTYAVTCSYNENGNYTVTFEGKETALVIEAAEIDSVTVTSSHTYNGQTYTPTLTVKAGELALNPSEYDVSYDKEEVKNADTYTVTVTAKESGNFKDKAEKASAQFRIEKAKVTITAENKHSPQKQDLLELTAKVEGLIDPDQFEKGVDYELTTDATKDSAVDTYTITVTVKEGREAAWPNYEIKTVNGQYQITIAAFAELVFNDASKPYNGEAQKIEATLPHSDQGEYSVEYAYWKGEAESGQSISADEMVNAGKYTIVATVSFADNNGETYEATFTATLTIEKIKVTVKFEAKSSTYGEAVETDLTYTMSEGVLAKDTETVKAAIEPYTDAESKSNVGGSYKITAAKPVLDNYDLTIEDGVYTITARPVTVTVKKQTVTFNQGAQKASSETAYWTVDDLAAGDEASVLNVKLEAEGTDAKAYDIAASYQNNNYTVTFKGEGDLAVEGSTVKAAFVIEAATLTGAELTGSYTYNGNEQTPTFTVKAGSLTVAEGDYELAYADGADRVSAGTVQVTVKPKSENYTGTVETQFTIAQKQIKVTLTAQTAEYSGEVPTPAQDKYTVEEGGLCSRNGKEDDLGITITLVNGQKDAGDYGLTAEASNDDYEVTFEKSAKFTVTKKAITVKADDLTSVYGEAVQKLTYTAEGLVAGEDPQTVLHIELQASRSIKEAGTYEVTGTGSATNYTFEVTPGTYTVKEREVTVRINDQSALYNGKEPSVPQEQNKGWTITDGSIIDGDNLLIVLTKEAGVNADDYEINGAFTNDNYKVTFEGTLGTAGKFTIDARTLTVVIEDQSATYNYQHQYTFDTAKWHVKTGVGDGLAEGEEKDVLAVTLTKPEMTDAGEYEIAGAWDNENYTVTFEGTKQTKGTFTVEKQDVSDGAKFILGVEGGNFTTDGARGVRAKFAGEELVLFASASYFEGTEDKTLEVTIDPAKIGEIGEFEVTVTITDKNYCGQTVFNVVVTDAAGYTKKLTEVLEQLETLAKGLDIDALKAEDYATLTEMYKAIQTLDEEERETGASALAEYQAYIDAWNALADTDAAAETAESIANGPMKGLFAGTAVMTALAALAYIVKKGGIL